MKIPRYLLIYHEVKVTVLSTTSPKSEEIQDWLVIGGGVYPLIQKTQSIFLNHSLNKLRNISRQVNFKYIILSCNLPFCRCKNFGVLAKKKRSNGGGHGPPALPPWSANGNPEGVENNS